MTIRIAETKTANRIVSQNACQSMTLPYAQPVLAPANWRYGSRFGNPVIVPVLLAHRKTWLPGRFLAPNSQIELSLL
jgi:hypothetical protein